MEKILNRKSSLARSLRSLENTENTEKIQKLSLVPSFPSSSLGTQPFAKLRFATCKSTVSVLAGVPKLELGNEKQLELGNEKQLELGSEKQL